MKLRGRSLLPDTYADNMSLQVFHSGGPGWQPSVELCLGGERSITPAVMLTVQRYSAIGGIRIERVANGPGIGYMDAPTTDSLRWKAPGDTNYGATIDIAVGETMTLPSEDGDKSIQVTRVLDNDLSSTEIVCLVDTCNNICGGPNFVSEDANGNTYSLAALYNGGSAAVTLTQLDATGCSVFFEAPVSDAVQIVADEFTVPIGASWITTWSAGDIVIAAGAWYGLWIKRAFTATISAQIPAAIELTYTSGAVTGLRCDLRGLTRRGQASHEALLLFVGVDAQPDYEAAPADSGATLADLTYDIIPAEEHTYYWEILDRNPFGLIAVSQGAEPYYVAADGTGAPAPPADPSQVFLLAQEDGTILVSAEYTSSQDSTSNRANRWLVYETFDGTAPNPAVDTPVEYLLAVGLPMEHVTAAQIDDTPYKVIVHTARYDSDAVLEAESLDDTVHTATATYAWFPTRRPDVTVGRGQGQKVAFVEPDETVVIDAGTNTRWIITASNTQLWYGDTLVYVLTDTELRTTFAFQTGTVSGAAASSVEVSGGKIYFSAAGVRQVEIDPAGTISIERVANGDNEAAVATIPGAPTLTTRCTYTQSNAYAYGGTYSALMAADGTAGISFQRRMITTSLASFKLGAKYTLSAWVYIPAGCTVSYARIQLYLNGVLYQTATVTTKGSWIFTTITATAPAESTSSNWHLILTVSGDSSNLDNKVYWDNISLVEVEDTPTITVGSIDESVAVDEVNEPGATWVRYGELVFPVYSPIPGSNIAAFAVDSAGVVKTDITAVVCNTDEECF
jgi:hypothetical protein